MPSALRFKQRDHAVSYSPSHPSSHIIHQSTPLSNIPQEYSAYWQLAYTPRLLPQSLQLLKYHQICIQKPIHALPHARLLIFVQLTLLNCTCGNAFLEAGIRKTMNGW